MTPAEQEVCAKHGHHWHAANYRNDNAPNGYVAEQCCRCHQVAYVEHEKAAGCCK